MNRLLTVAVLCAFLYPASAVSATKEDVARVIDYLKNKKDIPGVERHERMPYDNGVMVKFDYQNRRYFLIYSGSYRYERMGVLKEGVVVNKRVAISLNEQFLTLAMRPDGPTDEGRLFTLDDIGLQGRATGGAETLRDDSDNLKNSRFFFGKYYGCGTSKKESCPTRGLEFESEWQNEYDTILLTVLEFFSSH